MARDGGEVVPDPLVEEINSILSHVLETVQDLHGVPGSIIVNARQVPLHGGERVSHCCRVGEMCRAEGGGDGRREIEG